MCVIDRYLANQYDVPSVENVANTDKVDSNNSPPHLTPYCLYFCPSQHEIYLSVIFDYCGSLDFRSFMEFVSVICEITYCRLKAPSH